MNVTAACDRILQRLRQELHPGYTYHNYEHTVHVMDAVSFLCIQENVTNTDKDILLTAAAYHDAGFLISHKDHELHSCSIVKQVLPGFGYSQEEISAISQLILATSHGYIPANINEMIIRDADVDYLGTDHYETLSNALRKEFIYTGMISSDDEAWLQLQINYLTKHRFYTATSIRLREPNKQKTLNLLLNSN